MFYISNKDNEISQYLEYFPFGETLVEEHKNSNNSPCKFNAKELDNETGNYYYGARYYNPKFSIWLSVDPLAEKYPGWSPYNYTLLNPVVFVDPDGKSVDIPDNWYEDKKSGEVIWLNSTKEYDGYKNLGYHSGHTDGWGKRTHYNGDTRTKYVNYEPVKTYKESSLRQTYNFVTDELVAPVLEGAQIVGRHIPLAVGKAVSLSYKDIKAGGDGANIHADMKMPMYTFQNGKMRKTDLNEYSSGEISSSGFSALTAPVNMVKSGIKGIGAYINFISDQTISFFAGKFIENLDENK